MNDYRADLHIHSVLSPCGDLEMSPVHIVDRARREHLDIIGITDHNSTRHGALMRKLGAEAGIYVLTGAEVTTREEVHCLAFFENQLSLDSFQEYLTGHLTAIRNKPDLFGYQVVVDEQDQIVEEIEPLLIAALDQSLEEVEREIRLLNGLFIPAHVDRPGNGILSQLGILPPRLMPDAVEISGSTMKDTFLFHHPEFKKFSLIKNSDAHMLSQIGLVHTRFRLGEISFHEIRMALHHEKGREAICL